MSDPLSHRRHRDTPTMRVGRGSRREDRAAPARRPRPLLRGPLRARRSTSGRARCSSIAATPRARAYIDRARSALAERQRESEELLQNGVAAFQRGEGDEARRLLQAAIDGGAPSEEALAVLDRLNRLETAAVAGRQRAPTGCRDAGATRVERRRPPLVAVWRAALGVVGAVRARRRRARSRRRGAASTSDRLGSVGPARSPESRRRRTPAPAPVAREVALPLPRRGEMALTQRPGARWPAAICATR